MNLESWTYTSFDRGKLSGCSSLSASDTPSLKVLIRKVGQFGDRFNHTFSMTKLPVRTAAHQTSRRLPSDTNDLSYFICGVWRSNVPMHSTKKSFVVACPPKLVPQVAW